MRHARGTTIGEIENQMLTKLVLNTADGHYNEHRMRGDAIRPAPRLRPRHRLGRASGSRRRTPAENALAELGLTGIRFTLAGFPRRHALRLQRGAREARRRSRRRRHRALQALGHQAGRHGRLRRRAHGADQAPQSLGQSMNARTGPLSDVRVLDLTQALAGPFCTMLLADLGADVIKVEPPAGDMSRAAWDRIPADRDGCDYGGYFASVNRNKRSIVLDLKTDDGPRRASSSSSRPPTRSSRTAQDRRDGSRWASATSGCAKSIRALVYAAIRGFGDPRTGASPYADWPAFDIVAQSMGGLVAITGPRAARGSERARASATSIPARSPRSAWSRRFMRRGGPGRDSFSTSRCTTRFSRCARRSFTPTRAAASSADRAGNGTPVLCPFDIFPTRDGAVAIAAPGENHWKILCDAIGRPDSSTDDRTRNVNRRVAQCRVRARRS